MLWLISKICIWIKQDCKTSCSAILLITTSLRCIIQCSCSALKALISDRVTKCLCCLNITWTLITTIRILNSVPNQEGLIWDHLWVLVGRFQTLTVLLSFYLKHHMNYCYVYWVGYLVILFLSGTNASRCTNEHVIKFK